MKFFEKRAIVYTAGCHGLIHVLELSYGALLVHIANEFGASLFIMGILANVFGLAFGIMGFPAGLLADRFNERRLLMVCCISMGIASIVIVLSPSIYILGTGLMILGLSLGIYHPVSFAFITRVTTNRGMSFAYLGMGGNLGVAIGPLLASSIASIFSWRETYIFLAIPALILAVGFYFFSKVEIPTPKTIISEVKIHINPPRLLIVPLILVFIAATMNGFIYRGIVTFLPLYLNERINFSLFNMDSALLAGSFTTIALAFGVGGQFLGGYLSDRKSRETLVFIVSLIAVPMLLLMGSSQGVLLIVVSTIFAFFYFMGQPIYNVLLADYSPSDQRGRIFGLYFLCAFGLGSFSASILGYIAGKFGTNWVFTSSAGFGMITIVSATLLFIRALKIHSK